MRDRAVSDECRAIHEPGSAPAAPPALGGKARGLLAIAEAGLITPPWFAVLPGSVRADGSVSDAARMEIGEACGRLRSAGADSFAVRSSAQDEDAPERSFAGQYRTYLDVRGVKEVLEAISDCIAWQDRGGVDAYRLAGGTSSPGSQPAVIVQQFVHPRIAGVAFSREPLTGADDVVITATRLVGGALSSGEATGDEYRVGTDDRVVVTRFGTGAASEGADAGVGHLAATRNVRRVLSDEQTRSVARAARLLERRRGAPQDVEWAYSAGGELFILQARPITALPAATPCQPIRVWDNANIVESFPDLTLPLTFSVAVGLYAAVYRGMCLALGVPRRAVEREAPVFEQMLGLLQGRVYYNLSSWYRVLSLLPGFRLTSGFLEAMMGAARPGAQPSDRSAAVVPAAARSREVAGMTFRLSLRMVRFGSDAAHFRRSIAGLLEDHRDGPGPGAAPEELLDEFERVRAAALLDWRTPIMNDLFLMLSHGALRRLADRWLGTDARKLVNALLVQGSVASAMPGEELLRIAVAIRRHSLWSSAIVTTPPEELVARLRAEPDLAGLGKLIDGYLEAWGDRAPRELQLERPSYRDDPLPVLRAIRSLVGAPSTPGKRVDPHAARRVGRRLLAHPAGPLRLAVLWILVLATRRHIRWREEMRLARGQVFAVGRRIFRRLGEEMSEQGLLARPDDVHFLSFDELRGMTRGTSAIGNPRALIRLRRAQYDDYASRPPLPSRFETRGLVSDPLHIEPAPTTAAGRDARFWRGIGAAHGRARGPCLVVRDPSTVQVARGQIIAARSTDPGWVPVLVGAAGLLVEHGSLLSHSAIVARELGIPTVVGVAGLLDVVHSGDLLELDGSTGEVTLLAPLEGAA